MRVLQGFPITLILFMLFTAPLFKILTKEDKNARVKIYGYVDNSHLTSRGPKEEVSAAKIQKTFVKVEVLVIENCMVFNSAKFEVIHFSQKQNFSNPEIVLLPATTALMQERLKIIKSVAKNGSIH